MSILKNSLGKIFISHSSKDKPFVRRLSARLRKEGYQIWLDEHELLPGDPLVEKISNAISSSKVVLVVVTPNSLKSKWLKFELNMATDRMVKGQCRLIPVIKGIIDLPSEVKGLLYADFNQSFKYGFKSILTALQYEENRIIVNGNGLGFWFQIEAILEKVFDFTAYGSMSSEYQSKDYSMVGINIPSDANDETYIPYEIVHAYIQPAEPLNERWWQEYKDAMQMTPETWFLLVTERPVAFPIEIRHPKTEKIGIIQLKYAPTNLPYCSFVIVDLSDVSDHSLRIDLVTMAKMTFVDLVQEKNRLSLVQHKVLS